MLIGVPKEIKKQEHRVGLLPFGVRELVNLGHEVWIEKNAGMGLNLSDNDYEKAGAKIVSSGEAIYSHANLVVKVKEPQLQECKQLHQGQILFAYLHLAADLEKAELLRRSGCTAIAYETVTDTMGQLPLLMPMSQIAGRLSIQVGAHYLERSQGGMGILLGGVASVEPATVLIIGAGAAGTQAMKMALGLQANVIVLDKSLTRIQWLHERYGNQATFLISNQSTLDTWIAKAHLVVGAVLLPGAVTPKIISRKHLSTMKKSSVIVDLSIDQGGCAETSQPTTHDAPIYEVEGVIHYCVTNLPGCVPTTASHALSNATLPSIMHLANHGLEALKKDPFIRSGLNIHEGKVTHHAVAHEMKVPYIDPIEALR